jgi:hypothetical protein
VLVGANPTRSDVSDLAPFSDTLSSHNKASESPNKPAFPDAQKSLAGVYLRRVDDFGGAICTGICETAPSLIGHLQASTPATPARFLWPSNGHCQI